MACRVIFVTGIPGVGKTTLVMKVADYVKSKGYGVGGVVTEELREGGVRVGFKIMDLYTGATGLLAHTRLKEGPRLGRYVINIKDLESVGVRALLDGLERREVNLIVLDEIGPMELCSSRFTSAARKAILGGKPFLGTVQLKLSSRIGEVLGLAEAPEMVELTHENRVRQTQLISERLFEAIREVSGG
ncbi:MAG: nucleoside-triphosphatase [Candidatus Bathyarchaeia archaeon]